MKIKIKEFQGQPCVRGFFPRAGVRLLPGQVFEFKEGEEALFEACMNTDFVQEVRDKFSDEPKKRGRPRREEAESGA